MKLPIILSLLLLGELLSAQTLPVPARNLSSLNGTQIVSAITNLSLQNREIYIENEVMNGNIPDFYRTMKLVKDSATISGTNTVISYYVIPDYLALGCDTNYFLCPMTPILGQKLATALGCMLPTRKMVNQIWANATVKMQPESIPPSGSMTTVPIFNQHNGMVWTQRQTFMPAKPLGHLVAGDKKDVVVSNLIYTTAAPARVVIYGWHYPTSGNIQPLYAGHIDTYADYSHGIRLVQKEMYLNGVPTQASTILNSSVYNGLLSDEGIIAQAYYPDTATVVNPTPVPVAPTSFCVLGETATSARIIVSPVANATGMKVYQSIDGITFSGPVSYASNNFLITGLDTTQTYYFKIAAFNTTGTSPNSEVLGVRTSNLAHKAIIVNGFDRASTGNTYNFIRQHAKALDTWKMPFSSATNDAVINGLLLLGSYEMADYILGEESTAQETFSTAEQNLVKSFLNQGGYLLVSGSEIGWDLDHLGNAGDKDFYNNYLKASYIDDAPNGQASAFYTAESISGSIFQRFDTVAFDNGTFGTYNVDYPDVITPFGGGLSCLNYTNTSSLGAAVYFEGLFPGATQDTGKVVYLGFPFETIYNADARDSVMGDVLDFFFPVVIPQSSAGLSNYGMQEIVVCPNPSNSFITVSSIKVMEQIQVFDINGALILSTQIRSQQHVIDIAELPSGIYIVKVLTEKGNVVRKIQKQ